MSNFVINPSMFVVPRTIWYDTLSDSAAIEAISNSPTARGEGMMTGSSSMIGEKVGQVKCRLKDQESGASLDGTITCEIKTMATNSNVKTIATMNASELTSSFEVYTFTTATPYTLLSGQTVCISYDSGSSSKEIGMQMGTASTYDGTNSGKSYLFDTTWSTDSKDWIASISD